MKVFAYCLSCDKEYDITRWSNKYGIKCDADGCDGYVITPSGKIKPRIEGDFSKPPEPLFHVV